MGEPARKDVYDPGSEEPITRPNLRALEGGRETTEPKRGHLKSVGDGDETKTSSPEALRASEKSATGAAAGTLNSREQSAAPDKAEDQIASGYNPNDNTRIGRLIQFAAKGGKGKKYALGGGVAGGIITFLILAFLALLPLKINHIVENLQSRFFASSESAVSRRTEYLFSRYIKKYVLPGLNTSNCKSTARIDKNCINPINGETPAAKLFRGWRDARLENKLADRYGVEFIKKQSGFTLKVRGLPDSDIGDDFLRNDLELKDIGKGEFRKQIKNAMNQALEGESRWKKLMYRFKVGRLVERKYGVERCVFACKTKDKLSDWGTNKKRAAQMMITRRVIEPHTQMVGFALACILDGGCDAGATTDGNDSNDTQRRDKLDRQIRDYLAQRSIQYTEDTIQKITDETLAILDKGFSQYLLEKVTSEGIAKLTTSSTNVIAWVDTAAQVINTVRDAGPKLRRWTFVINSTAMVGTYMLYRSYADELKTGKVDSELLGSMVNTLGDSAGGVNNQGQPAEVSPLYGDLFGSSSAQTSLMDILSPTAYAAESVRSGPAQYTCDDDKPVPTGKLVCPEENLLANNFLTRISDAFDRPPLNLLSGAASAWKSTVGGFVKAIGSALGQAASYIPGYNIIQARIGELVSGLMQSVAEWLIPSPVSTNMSGARAFNMIAGGADVAGNDFAHYGLGGNLLTADQVTAIRTEQEEAARQQFTRKSVFARFFDKEDRGSLVSRVAMSMPTTGTSVAQSTMSSLLSNPLVAITRGFSAVFSSPKLRAATTAEDPFGVPQYGYALNDPALTTDPDILTDQYCTEFNTRWANSAQEDPVTGMDYHTTTNPCLLEQATVGSAGGYFTSDVLTAEDLGNTGRTSAIPLPTPATGGIVGDIGESSESVACAAGTKDLGVVTSKYTSIAKKTAGPLIMRLCQLTEIGGNGNDAAGRSIGGGAVVNSRVSSAWQALGQQAKADGVPLAASSSFRLNDSCSGTGDGSLCARPGSSPHQLGVAIDFQGTRLTGRSTTSCSGRARDPASRVWTWLYANAEKYGFKQYSYESWHWDPMNTVSRCGSSQ